MANITIPEEQLKTWAKEIQLNKNDETYERVENIFRGKYFNNPNNFELYLQGSVANSTNIWADGDIDIVFHYKYNYSPNIYVPSSYTLQDLRNEIISVLENNNIQYENKNKCIKLNLKGGGWQDVDLVPCFPYRNHYERGEEQFYEGIRIETLNNKVIINYPKQHKANGEKKNGYTNNYYKKIVRIFKNIKKKLVKENYIQESLAPSYFIECLIYNVPNEKFYADSFQSIVYNCLNCLNWLKESHNLQGLKCQNEITNLFGSENTQWNLDNCEKFIVTAKSLYMRLYSIQHDEIYNKQ